MNAKLFKILLISLVIIAIVGLGAIIFILLNDDDPDREPTIDEQIAYSFTTEEINIDLKGNSFARIQFNIITNSSDATEEIEKRQFQFKNLLIKESVDVTASELQSDLEEFEMNLKNKMNELMTEGEITDIYIVSKIVQ
ncbi:flagellar FliL protein [Natronobacillus azotifigens]|uniref:Flagellar basal body-associated protein FliL n=1 Tax=Natronobacillus azotifigens TaxID=472978 RepID=A0A9J6RA62_9BACI|nr:flagellar basal body-associated FliL family protein [Natronobacillus azotifigens]MCZ0702570.1 flagellar basal body-associated protein FliL [Natronobacillus azotifigens]